MDYLMQTDCGVARAPLPLANSNPDALPLSIEEGKKVLQQEYAILDFSLWP
jgi:hypothetical protein